MRARLMSGAQHERWLSNPICALGAPTPPGHPHTCSVCAALLSMLLAWCLGPTSHPPLDPPPLDGFSWCGSAKPGAAAVPPPLAGTPSSTRPVPHHPLGPSARLPQRPLCMLAAAHPHSPVLPFSGPSRYTTSCANTVLSPLCNLTALPGLCLPNWPFRKALVQQGKEKETGVDSLINERTALRGSASFPYFRPVLRRSARGGGLTCRAAVLGEERSVAPSIPGPHSDCFAVTPIHQTLATQLDLPRGPPLCE